MDTTYDVFLSHNSADKPAVEELVLRLIKEEIEPTAGPVCVDGAEFLLAGREVAGICGEIEFQQNLSQIAVKD